jgi:hypothetical protein
VQAQPVLGVMMDSVLCEVIHSHCDRFCLNQDPLQGWAWRECCCSHMVAHGVSQYVCTMIVARLSQANSIALLMQYLRSLMLSNGMAINHNAALPTQQIIHVSLHSIECQQHNATTSTHTSNCRCIVAFELSCLKPYLRYSCST